MCFQTICYIVTIRIYAQLFNHLRDVPIAWNHDDNHYIVHSSPLFISFLNVLLSLVCFLMPLSRKKCIVMTNTKVRRAQRNRKRFPHRTQCCEWKNNDDTRGSRRIANAYIITIIVNKHRDDSFKQAQMRSVTYFAMDESCVCDFVALLATKKCLWRETYRKPPDYVVVEEKCNIKTVLVGSQ